MAAGDRITALVLATVALAAMSGCGGSAATSTSTTTSSPAAQVVSASTNPAATTAPPTAPTTAGATTTGGADSRKFVAQANAICRHQDETMLSVLLGGAKRRRWVTPAAAIQEAERQLAALVAPSALNGAWTQIRADRAVVARNLLSPGQAGAPQARASAAQLRQARADLARVAGAAGLAACAKIV